MKCSFHIKVAVANDVAHLLGWLQLSLFVVMDHFCSLLFPFRKQHECFFVCCMQGEILYACSSYRSCSIFCIRSYISRGRNSRGGTWNSALSSMLLLK